MFVPTTHLDATLFTVPNQIGLDSGEKLKMGPSSNFRCRNNFPKKNFVPGIFFNSSIQETPGSFSGIFFPARVLQTKKPESLNDHSHLSVTVKRRGGNWQ